ncbi:hypothetical protein [Methanobrevibacter sp.]|uniref:hypothetical protein n=1 Tax=Methanobrevibacter sp. TaxID=66852 RepID=UPI00388D5007
MDEINKIALVAMTLLILICGLSFATAVNFTHNDAQHIHKDAVPVKKIDNSTFKNVSTSKAVVKNDDLKKSAVKKSSKKQTVKKHHAQTKTKVKSQAKSENVVKSDESVSAKNESTPKPYDKTINGWNPKDHEVSREDLGDGMERINYDDGYSRLIDQDGNVITYGY